MKKYKNYVILIVATLAIFYVAWWVLAQYKVYNDYQKNISALEKQISVVQPLELKPYVRENASFVMYVANTHVNKTGSFENNLVKVIDQYSLKDRIVLYNISANPKTLIKELNDYLNDDKFGNLKAPALLYFDQGELKDVLYDNSKTITQKDMYNFLKENNMVDND